MLLALALVELLVKPFAAFLDADLTLNYVGHEGMLLPAILLTLIVGVISGLYPAFFLSKFQPAQVLKANRSAAETPGSGRLRAALVVAQFAVSIGLIICTAVIYGQTVYARHVDPGYKRDHILQVEELGRAQLFARTPAIVDRLKRVPGVVAAGLTDIGIDTNNNNNAGIVLPGSTKLVTIGQYQVSDGFLDAMGLTLKAGRWFDHNRPMDDATQAYPPDKAADLALARRGVNVVLNEYAVKKLGFKSPQDAIGKTVKSELFNPEDGLVNINIVGVVGDSRFRSVRTPIDPIMFRDVTAGPKLQIDVAGLARPAGQELRVLGIECAEVEAHDGADLHARVLRYILQKTHDSEIALHAPRDDGKRPANHLVGAVALRGLFLGEHGSLGRRQGRSCNQRQINNLEEIVIGEQPVLGRLSLSVFQEHRTGILDVHVALDFGEILEHRAFRHVARHLQKGRRLVLRVRVPGLELVGVLHVRKPRVVALLVADVEQDHHARGHADREAGDVDDRIGPVLGKCTNGDRPIIPPHGDCPLQELDFLTLFRRLAAAPGGCGRRAC
jgi:hypothetical protein